MVDLETMFCLKYDLNDERVQYLIQTDKTLAKLIRYIGDSELILENDGFKCLVKYIIGQQISDKARETIWQRLYTNWGDVTPDIMIRTNEKDFRKVGLSGRKIDYIKTLATNVVEKKIVFEDIKNLSNEEIITKLTVLKGVGRWTAEMYLIFSLGRENVLSKSDGTIKRTIQWMYDLEDLPSSETIENYFANWMKYATIVSSYLWRSISLGLTQMPFNLAILKRRQENEQYVLDELYN